MTVTRRHLIALAGSLLLAAVLAGIALYRIETGLHRGKGSTGAANATAESNAAISPKDQAEALHFVIAADREMYCKAFLATRSADSASQEPPAAEKISTPDCPSIAFREAAESVQVKGADFSYALRSLTPVDRRNGPQTELEQTGMAFLASHPNENYYGEEMLGGRHYFTAVYPDIPAEAACVECHNRISPSIPRRHQAGEILGGIVVRVPLED